MAEISSDLKLCFETLPESIKEELNRSSIKLTTYEEFCLAVSLLENREKCCGDL